MLEEHQPYDKSSKWLIQHHGDSMLRLAKIENIQSCRPAQAEVARRKGESVGGYSSAHAVAV